MADPLAITSLALQIGTLLKQLYDYGKDVKSAQNDLINLSCELSALKSIFELESRYGSSSPATEETEFKKMLATTQALLEDLSQICAPRSSKTGRALQSLKLPFHSVSLQERFTKLERLKTWFLLAFVLHNKLTSDTLSIEMKGLTDSFQNEMLMQRQKDDETANQKLLTTLAPVSPEVSHLKACRTWQGSQSGTWFCEAHLQTWLESTDHEESVALLSGSSGAGKTTLLSRAVEQTKKYAESSTSPTSVAYFYCAYNDLASQEPRNVAGSWLAQLSEAHPAVLEDFDLQNKKLDTIPIAKIENALLQLSNQTRLILFLDAVNESSEALELGQMIQRLVSASTNIKCFVSATPHFSAVARIVRKSSCIFEMQQHALIQDIEDHVKRRISTHPVLSRVKESEILEALIPHCEGMYRWIDCQMNFLDGQMTVKSARKALHNLPGDLNGTYSELLQRILTLSAPAKAMVREILLWLSFCQRPMKLEELCEAVVVDEDDRGIDDESRIQDPGHLLSLCQGLVKLDTATNTVVLAHGSIKTFLVGDYIRTTNAAYFAMEPESALRCIIRKSLAYLLMDNFSRGDYFLDFEETQDLDDIFRNYPLLDYCATQWALNANSVRILEPELNLILRLFQTRTWPTGGNFTFWLCCLVPQEDVRFIYDSEPLYYAASYGLTSVVRMLLESGLVGRPNQPSLWNIDCKGGRFHSTAIQAACYRGHSKVVDLLLDAGADPTLTDESGITSVKWATIRGHLEIATKLSRITGEKVDMSLYYEYGFEVVEARRSGRNTNAVPYPGRGTEH